MGKRRDNRVFACLPVRVSGTDYNGNSFTQTAQTLDVSRVGVRIGGIRCLRAAGEMVTLECGGQSARFMVVWIGTPGSDEDGCFGAKSLQPEKRLFRIELGDPRPDSYVPAEDQPPEHLAPAIQPEPQRLGDNKERRGAPRVRCSGTGQIKQPGVAFPIWTTVSDISTGGCYLELVFTMPRLSPVDLQLTIKNRVIVAKGVVVTSHPGIGVGIRFTELDEENRSILERILDELITQRQQGQLGRGASS